MLRNAFRLGFLVFVLSLAACSFAPLPISINLLENGALAGTSGSFELLTPANEVDLTPYLGASARGTLGPFESPFAGFSVDVVQAAALLGLDIVIPDGDGFDIDFSDQALPADLTEATLSYTLDLSTTGGVSGQIGLQPYLAPADSSSLISPAYALGGVQQVTLDGDSGLESIVSLNAAQLRGINEGHLRLAIAVVEGTLSFSAAGQASVTYTLASLALNVDAVSARVSEKVPGPRGELLDFSDQDVPFGRVVSLGFDYAVRLELDERVTGSARLQLYVAPADAPNLFDPAYAFGVNHSLDLSQQAIVIADRAELRDAQQTILDDKRLRLGILVTGEADVVLGQPLQVSYEFTDLELFGGYSLN